ncbi:MAG: VWA domain-containing protein, partial [Acidobacteriota bacterium]|nr:VWA domain-containing protein [Acidobacteriota bacterium]
MNRFIPALLLSLAATGAQPPAQAPQPAAPASAVPDAQSTISVTSREVLVDVLVTDHHGNPVTGLKQSDFSVTEQGRPQTITFFEEHTAQPGPPIQLPKLPPDVFTNISPFHAPPVVNVLLLDSLNTPMDQQSYVHTQALKFLSSAQAGQRMAIFTMGLGLHFVQGFTDDPTLLVAALKNHKNNEIQSAEMLKGQEETNAQQNLLGTMSEQVAAGGGQTATAASPEMVASLQNFINENDISQSTDRIFLTLENLQRLATFLNSFPGRKNVIWFSQSVPTIFAAAGSAQIDADPRLSREIKTTLAMLASARVALYPVESAGVTGNALYQAGTVLPNANQAAQLVGPPAPAAAGAPSSGTGGFSQNMTAEDQQRNANQENMKLIAEDSGGRAFVSTNSLSTVLSKVTSASDDFYTLTYTPTNSKMDGTYRNIRIQVPGDHYDLSYRRGYYAVDSGLPGDAMQVRRQAIQ